MDEIFSALVGFDGFVDNILSVVDKRLDQGNNFQKISTMQNFAKRVHNASGKSTNIELFPLEQRIGGNGPILAQALAFYGIRTHLIGLLDDPIFQKLHKNIHPISIGTPGITNALEFDDGKLLLGITHPLDQITLAQMLPILQPYRPEIFHQNLFCFTNWTMTLHMNEILQYFLSNIDNRRETLCFFDLADPEKRSTNDLIDILFLMQKYSAKVTTILGLNLKEAEQLAHTLKTHYSVTNCTFEQPIDRRIQYIQELSLFIKKYSEIDEIFVHDTSCCAGIVDQEPILIDGICEKFYVEHPKTTTGAGDHFNAGYLLARLQKKSLHESLCQAYNVSSHFVKTGLCPLP